MATFRGYPACSCQIEWLPAYEAELQRRGLLNGALRIYQLIGGYSGSGGTHSTGGASDVIDLPGGDEEVWVARQMGADATWARKYNWDGKNGIAHLHSVLRDCPHNGPARYQIAAVDAGYNGLGSGGRGARDDGPRPLSGRTWREGIAWAKEQGDDMPYSKDELSEIVRKQIDAALSEIGSARIDSPKDDGPKSRAFDKILFDLRDDVKAIKARKCGCKCPPPVEEPPAESKASK